jgi:hypothetical protein
MDFLQPQGDAMSLGQNAGGPGRISGYFLIGNGWLFVALVLMLGRTIARTDPTFYTFFDLGGWLNPLVYNSLVLLCLVAAGICLRLHFASRAR